MADGLPGREPSPRTFVAAERLGESLRQPVDARGGRGAGRGLRCSIVIAALVTISGAIAVLREGAWSQVPFWDSAWFHANALRFHQAMVAEGLEGFCGAWVWVSGTHAPLVSALSGLLMIPFGASRPVAEAVLPLSAFLLLLSTYRATDLLWGRATARATTALVATFPVFLTYTRNYYFEAPLAALFAASCWALVASDGLGRWTPTLLFGALAGLQALARTGGSIFVVGPAVVAAIVALRMERPWARLGRLAVATALALGLAATWYGPNLDTLAAYLQRCTWGDRASFYAGGATALTLENVSYSLQWAILAGPGVPMAVVALGAVALAACRRPRPRATSVGLALASVAAIDFALVLLAAQRMGATLLLPLMPLLALAIVRAVASIRALPLRLAASAAVAGLGAWNVVACTFLFEAPRVGDAPRPMPFPNDRGNVTGGGWILGHLGYHGSFLLDWSHAGGGEVDVDYRIAEVIDSLERLALPFEARVAVVGDVCFFGAGTLEWEARSRGHSWHFDDHPKWFASEAMLDECFRALAERDVVVLRAGGRYPEPSLGYAASFDRLRARGELAFDEVAEPTVAGDGAEIRIYRQKAALSAVAFFPPEFVPLSAAFGDPERPAIRLEAGSIETGPRGPVAVLGLQLDPRATRLPSIVVQVLEGTRVVATRGLPSVAVVAEHDTATHPVRLLVRIPMPAEEGTREIAGDRVLALGFLAEPSTPESARVRSRLRVTSSLRVHADETIVSLPAVMLAP